MQNGESNNDWINTPAAAMHLPDLADKTALVTGASTGIGAATIKLLRQQQCRCFGLALNEDSHRAAPDFFPVQCDLSKAEDIEWAIQEVCQQTEHLDYLVNVAGIDPKLSLDEGDATQWNKIVDLNLRGYYLLIRATLPLLQAGTGKAIVNVSSINYRLGLPGRSIYSATKAGILGLTTGLARELGREGIRVNTVTPGWVFTERQVEEYFGSSDGAKHLATLEKVQSLKLQIQAEDIANHILFYLSAASRASTGHNCVVDAGWILE